MAENSKIAWTDHTFNPWFGCTRVSPGCQNCYAENWMDRRYKKVKWGPGQPRVRTKTWGDPEKWNRQAQASGIRKKVFCASLADWLDTEVPEEWLTDLMALIQRCPHLDWLMLTKRPERAFDGPAKWFTELCLPNVWFGVTAETQDYFNTRVGILGSISAAIRWVSYEPALGPLRYFGVRGHNIYLPDWLVIGGESSQMMPARPFAIEWAECAIMNCRDKGIVPFMKQIGSNAFYEGGRWAAKDKAGADPDEWPESIRVREFPKKGELGPRSPAMPSLCGRRQQ